LILKPKWHLRDELSSLTRISFMLVSYPPWQGFSWEHWGGKSINLHHPNGAPTMSKSTLLTAASALVLALATAMPSASFAFRGGGGGGGAHFGGGGGAHFGGGGGGAHFAGGGFAGRPAGGAAFAGSRPVGGAAGVAAARPIGSATAFAGGPRGWRGGGWHNGRWWPGAAFAAGAALGSYAYYGGGYGDPGYYYDNGYYGDYGPDYYSDSGVAVAPAPVGGDASYCAQRYRSYDPASGTYLGYDGQRHPCP
jgi:hypothetical protein